MNNNSYMKLFLVGKLFLCLCFFPLASYADDHEAAHRLIQAYIDALKSDDPVLIKSAWDALHDDQDALDYMQTTMPRLAYLFRIRGLSMEIQDIQTSRPEFFEGTSAVVGEVTKFSLSEPESKRRTNRDIVLDAQGRNLPDNREIVRSNPNQNRQDNEGYVQNRRINTFYQKFQDSPVELVPRGNIFPKTGPSTAADVRVQGRSTIVAIEKTSTADAVVDIFLNGRSVVRGLKLRDAFEAFNLYLDPGMNTLKLSYPPGLDKTAVSLQISFETKFGGKKQIPLALQQGQSQILTIEAAP